MYMTKINNSAELLTASQQQGEILSDPDMEAGRLPKNFFCEVGSADMFFDSAVKRALTRYANDPQSYSPEEELLIIAKYKQALGFETPGVADANGVYQVADEFYAIMQDDAFPYCSEMGKRFAAWCYGADEVVYSEYELTQAYGNKPYVSYDADTVALDDGWHSDTFAIAKMYKEPGTFEEAFDSLTRSSDVFRSFLSKTLNYKRRHFGESFPMDLFVKFMLGKTPDEYARCEQVLQSVDESQRIGVTEAFLATEFGDDFGDRILTISETFEQSASAEVFVLLQDIRDAASQLSQYYTNGIPGFGQAYETAWVKRTTELLATLADDTSSVQDKDDAVAALRIVAYAARTSAESSDGEFSMIHVEDAAGHATLRSADGRLTKTIRPSGDTPRIGDTVKVPKDLIPDGVVGKDRRLSVRLDFDTSGLSLDIGSSAREGVNSAGVGRFVAEQLARGELALMAQRERHRIARGSSAGEGEVPRTITLHGNHVREAFKGLSVNSQLFSEVVIDHVDALQLASTAAERAA